VSYDVAVFDPKVWPGTREGFIHWYEQQVRWPESHGYNNPDVCTPALRAWFMDMIAVYPAMNGPYASDDVDSPRLTDYTLGESIIYAALPSSEAEGAHERAFRLALDHNVGFFAVSRDGNISTPFLQ
jgi:hypothetical protein